MHFGYLLKSSLLLKWKEVKGITINKSRLKKMFEMLWDSIWLYHKSPDYNNVIIYSFLCS